MLRAIVSGGAFLAFVSLCLGTVSGGEASRDDRARMAVSVAECIRDEPKCARAFAGAGAVEIGAAAIEGDAAIADWREARGSRHGQVGFFYACDHWNVGPVTKAAPLRPAQLVTGPRWGASRATANKLVSELAQLESEHVAFLKPAEPGPDC